MRLPHPLAIEPAEYMRFLAILQRLNSRSGRSERLDFRRRQTPLNVDGRNTQHAFRHRRENFVKVPLGLRLI